MSAKHQDTKAPRHKERPRKRFLIAASLCVLMSLCLVVYGQSRGQRGAAQPAKSIAPVDLTGFWVSVVNEDWRHRMMTPRRGDFESVPLNPEGIRVANAWNIAKDDQAGLQC